MIEHFSLENLRKLVIQTGAKEDAERMKKDLMTIKEKAMAEELPSSFDISTEDTKVIISHSKGLQGTALTLYQLGTLSAENFTLLSTQMREITAKKNLAKNSIYARKQLGLSIPTKPPAPPAKNPEREALLEEQRRLQESAINLISRLHI